jgi:transcription termination factor NusB
MVSLRRIIDKHEQTMLQQILTIEVNQKKRMEKCKMSLKNELQSLKMRNATLEMLFSTKDHTKLIQVKQEFESYVTKTNETLQRLQMPTRTYHRLQGLDQLQEVKKKILQFGQYVNYSNPQLDKRIADNGKEQKLILTKSSLTDMDIKIVADALRNNTVRKICFSFT